MITGAADGVMPEAPLVGARTARLRRRSWPVSDVRVDGVGVSAQSTCRIDQ